MTFHALLSYLTMKNAFYSDFNCKTFYISQESPSPEKNGEDQSESSRQNDDCDMDHDSSSDENDCDLSNGDDVIDVGQE